MVEFFGTQIDTSLLIFGAIAIGLSIVLLFVVIGMEMRAR